MSAKMLTIKDDVSTAFFEFLTEFQKRVCLSPSKKNKFRIRLKRDMPGLFNLLDSFSAAQIDSRAILREWNPLSQRPTFAPVVDPSLAAYQLDKATETIWNFVESSHEATHVLLWEPFFVGKTKALSRPHFIETSLLFEGFCFWYGDIFLTRNLRVRLPDGEFVLSKNTGSQFIFHPYRAFRALGITDPKKILEIYLNSFTGGQTQLHNQRSKPFVATLCKRFTYFYAESLKPLSLLYSQLESAGILDEFYQRFCCLAGLPSLLPHSILDSKPLDNTYDYCLKLLDHGYRHMDVLSQDEVSKIRMRRLIQTRAYYAFTMLKLLEGDSTFSLCGEKLNFDHVRADIRQYIDSLETAIWALARNRNLTQIERLVRQTDAVYSRKVRSFFKKKDVWTKRSQSIVPLLKTKTSLMGLLGEEPVSRRDVAGLNKFILQEFLDPKVMKALTRGNGDQAQRLSEDAVSFVVAASHLRRKWTKDHLTKWKRAVNRLLLNPEILKIWSIPLSSIDPEQNSFREVLFRFF